MAIITLTTDLGEKDFYVPAVKGFLLSNIPSVTLVDITHQVSPFNIAEGAFILKGCYREFPPDTIHLISIDSDYEPVRYIGVRTRYGLFFAHDNGIIPLILEGEPAEEIISLAFSTEDMIFPLRKVIAPAVAALLKGLPFGSLGEAVPAFREKANLQPILDEDIIRGSVTYIDNFFNAITNISQAAFRKHARGRRFTIYVTPRERITALYDDYNQVPEGEVVCLFSTSGYLEIAINKGRASSLLGLRLGATVMVEFH